MSEIGVFGDGRTFELPRGWHSVRPEVLETALQQALRALEPSIAVPHLTRYYDREGDFAGTTFLDAQPHDPCEITAADLWAVATLSIPVNARQGRLLLDPGPARTRVRRLLRAIDDELPITDLAGGELGSAELLDRMWDLHHEFRSLLSTEDHDSIHWVFAAKLCARKRPELFPVRDTLVCRYLADRPLKSGNGWPGDLSIDIQVFAYLMSHPKIPQALGRLRTELSGLDVDLADLRFLDCALWMAAKFGDPSADASSPADVQRGTPGL